MIITLLRKYKFQVRSKSKVKNVNNLKVVLSKKTKGFKLDISYGHPCLRQENHSFIKQRFVSSLIPLDAGVVLVMMVLELDLQLHVQSLKL